VGADVFVRRELGEGALQLLLGQVESVVVDLLTRILESLK
jgi:hypothetical protein